MKLDRRRILWITAILSVGILAASLMIYLGHDKVDPYDMELLKNGMNDDGTDQIDANSGAAVSLDGIAGQDTGDQLNKRVTVGSSYSEKLAEAGSKNVLFLGTDKGNNLYDTIGIISIDNKNKKVSLIMLPRDMYVDYSGPVRDALQEAGKANTSGIYKLNAAHYVGAMLGYQGKFSANSISFLAQVIKEKFDIEIDDYVKISIAGFNQVVDLFGGVDIYVPYDMDYDDPAQELSIHLTKGNHHLNGKEAEGFVRFRQGYRADGTRIDVDRKKNQLAFLKAFIKQHGTLSNINKIPGLMETLGRNMSHSVNLGDMLLTYMGLARDIINDKYVIEEKNINGEEVMIKGVSYVMIK